MAELAGERRDVRILPFRGEYYKIRPERQNLVRNLIYPVPDPRFPFLGVHFTRLIHGGIEAGPNAVLAFGARGLPQDRFQRAAICADAADLRRLLAVPAQVSVDVLVRDAAVVQPRVVLPVAAAAGAGDPARRSGDGRLGRARAGHLAGGRLVQDFRFIERANALHVLNAPSPAATASLAIGAEIAGMVEQL